MIDWNPYISNYNVVLVWYGSWVGCVIGVFIWLTTLVLTFNNIILYLYIPDIWNMIHT